MSQEVGEPRSPWTRPWFIAASLVVALVVVLLVVVLISGDGDDGSGSSAAPSTPPASSIPTSGQTVQPTTPPGSAPPDDGVSKSVCGLPKTAREGKLVEPPAVSWDQPDRVLAPSSSDHGPGKISADGLRTCFSRTAPGALLAAANVVVMNDHTDRRVAGEFWEYFVADEPHRDVVIDAAVESAQESVPPQIAGYRLVSYSGKRAVIDVAVRLATGENGSWVLPLRWQDGDWRLDLNDLDGAASPEVEDLAQGPRIVPDFTSYTLWAG